MHQINSEIIDYPNCGICNKSTTTTEISRFEEARPLVPYENIKCSLCQFVASEKKILHLHMQKNHKERNI